MAIKINHCSSVIPRMLAMTILSYRGKLGGAFSDHFVGVLSGW